MDIITRQQALSLRLSKYFTGEPCKNGHVAERYTYSCTCQLCIRESTTLVSRSADVEAERLKTGLERAELDQKKKEMANRRLQLNEERLRLSRESAERRFAIAEQKLALSEKRLSLRPKPKRKDLVPFRAMLHYADVELFKATMWAYAIMSDPSITMVELMTNKTPAVVGEKAIHTFLVFQVDVDPLREFERGLIRERIASGSDVDDNARREEQRLRNAEYAEQRRLEDEDNGRPEWDGGQLN